MTIQQNQKHKSFCPADESIKKDMRGDCNCHSQSTVSQSPILPKESRKIEINLRFPDAIQCIMDGKKVRRTEWENVEEYCLLQDNFLTIHRNNKFCAWIVSEGDLLATDWVII